MVDLDKDDLALITQAIAIGVSPAGIVLDVADLARASYNLYQEKSDDNYFEVILCVIGFIPGPGDGVKAGLKIVNRKPEILFELIRFIMTHCKQYGDPEKWLGEIVNDKKIRELIRSAKSAALDASKHNIDNKYARYWIDQSIEITFDFLEASISSLIQLLARKILHWKTKVPKTSADLKISSGGTSRQNASAHDTTYSGSKGSQSGGSKASDKASQGKGAQNGGKTGKDSSKKAPQGGGKSGKDSGGKTGQEGDGKGGKGKSLSKADISSVLKNSHVGGVGEHMADYWAAKQLAVKVNHDDGKQPTQKLQRPMTKLHVGVNDQGIDTIWKSDKKNLGIMNTKNYAIIEAKASLTMGVGKGAGSLLNDLAASRDKTLQDNENKAAAKEKRKPKKLTPRQKLLIDQQMSKEWVNQRLKETGFSSVRTSGYSRHLLYFNYAHPETVDHLQALALSIKNAQPVIQADHFNEHTPSNFWGEAKIDEALNNRIQKANKKNGYP